MGADNAWGGSINHIRGKHFLVYLGAADSAADCGWDMRKGYLYRAWMWGPRAVSVRGLDGDMLGLCQTWARLGVIKRVIHGSMYAECHVVPIALLREYLKNNTTEA